MQKEESGEFISSFSNRSVEEILDFFLFRYKERIALASSFSVEDQVLTDLIIRVDPGARIFTIDTGRLPEETYEVIMQTMKKYGRGLEIYFPAAADVEEMESRQGPNLFYESIEKRKECCTVRKIRPLQRALRTLEVWITGLRKEQAVTRQEIKKIEWDETNNLLKLNPLADWTAEQVWDYIRGYRLPYNKLHDRGFPSIGCAPCTRAVEPGEDIRAGRWWWEAPEHKECGLHYRNGKLLGRRA